LSCCQYLLVYSQLVALLIGIHYSIPNFVPWLPVSIACITAGVGSDLLPLYLQASLVPRLHTGLGIGLSLLFSIIILFWNSSMLLLLFPCKSCCCAQIMLIEKHFETTMYNVIRTNCDTGIRLSRSSSLLPSQIAKMSLSSCWSLFYSLL